MDESKKKAIDIAISKLEKDFGKGIVMRLGDSPEHKEEVISTGSLLLDEALGVGGLPKGRIIEIYGPESSGKTTVALHAIAEVQKMGGSALFVDVEHALDSNYAKAIGVNIDELIISQPMSGEEALEITNNLVSNGPIDIVVIDSVAALVPKVEIEGLMGDSHIGLQARLMSQALRKLTGILHKKDTVAIFINQLREKVGVIYGNPEVTPGGRALKFYSTIRLDVRKGEQIKEGTNIIGNKVKVKVVKNKVAPPFRNIEMDLIYGKGFSKKGELLDLASKYEIIDKAGSWYSYNGEKLGQGRENAKTVFEQNEELFNEILNKVLEKMNINNGRG